MVFVFLILSYRTNKRRLVCLTHFWYCKFYSVFVKYFFPKFGNIFATSASSTGCTENGQPIRVTVHSELISDKLSYYMQKMGCSELKKNKTNLMNTLYLSSTTVFSLSPTIIQTRMVPEAPS